MTPSKMCVTHLTRDLKAFHWPAAARLLRCVSEKEILDWHILLEGPPSSPYEGGWYVMRIKFTPAYPFEAPAIMMLTPNRRFAENQAACARRIRFRRLRSAWSVQRYDLAFILYDDERTSGGVRTTDEQKRSLAEKSLAWNAAQPGLLKRFPELASKEKMEALKMENFDV